jgi:hypothetical protein
MQVTTGGCKERLLENAKEIFHFQRPVLREISAVDSVLAEAAPEYGPRIKHHFMIKFFKYFLLRNLKEELDKGTYLNVFGRSFLAMAGSRGPEEIVVNILG